MAGSIVTADTFEERTDGETLEEAWPSLSEPQKKAIVDQVAGVRKQLQSVTSASMQSVDQSPCYPGPLFFDLQPRGLFLSDLDLWNALSLNLNPPGKSFPQLVLENLKKHLPKCKPYVLTHCYLNLSNIMVRDGELTGILDWEYAGYYPIWYKYISASWRFTEMDAEWKGLLQQRLDVREDAKEFWMVLYHLRQYTDLDVKGQKALKRLS